MSWWIVSVHTPSGYSLPEYAVMGPFETQTRPRGLWPDYTFVSVQAENAGLAMEAAKASLAGLSVEAYRKREEQSAKVASVAILVLLGAAVVFVLWAVFR